MIYWKAWYYSRQLKSRRNQSECAVLRQDRTIGQPIRVVQNNLNRRITQPLESIRRTKQRVQKKPTSKMSQVCLFNKRKHHIFLEHIFFLRYKYKLYIYYIHYIYISINLKNIINLNWLDIVTSVVSLMALYADHVVINLKIYLVPNWKNVQFTSNQYPIQKHIYTYIFTYVT